MVAPRQIAARRGSPEGRSQTASRWELDEYGMGEGLNAAPTPRVLDENSPFWPGWTDLPPRFDPYRALGDLSEDWERVAYVEGLIDQGFESFDSTTTTREQDPAWALVSELVEAVARNLAADLRARMAKPETDEFVEDAVVFGPPKRETRLRGKIVNMGRGTPLIAPEDFEDFSE